MNWKKAVETFMTCMGFIGSIATIPTVIKIWFTHSNHADGQSIITWSFYAIMHYCGLFTVFTISVLLFGQPMLFI